MGSEERRDCFVIMPYGTRDYVELVRADERPTTEVRTVKAEIRYATVDFNRVYDDIIEKAVVETGYGLKCTRSDKVKESGMIHREMIRHIIDADVVIVDISLNNPNVFYELGVRHSLRRSTTVVIRHAGIPMGFPFNISGMRAIEYDDRTPEAVTASVERLRDAIKASFEGKDVDSLVHTLFNDILITRNAPPIMEQQVVEREIAKAPGRYVGYITGDITRVGICDAWVNAENTKMEMGRLHDDSISACIRFYGAERDKLNNVTRDIIREELSCLVGPQESVEPGTVLVTSSGQLKNKKFNVKTLLHVAALHGEPGKGYLPIRDYPGCILRVLEVVEDLNRGKTMKTKRQVTTGVFHKRDKIVESELLIDGKINSLLIPLFGSRTAGQHPQDVADQLFRAVSVFFQLHPKCELKKVYFLAYTQNDKQYCDGAIGHLDRLSHLVQPLGHGMHAGGRPGPTAEEPSPFPGGEAPSAPAAPVPFAPGS